MKVIFDLDGVLRDLEKTLRKRFHIAWYPDGWNYKLKDKGIFDWFKKDLSILSNASKTKYFNIIKQYVKDKDIEIWTNQNDEWKPYCLTWIKKYFPSAKIKFLSTEEKEKLLYSHKDYMLIEDSPHFKDYSKIILLHYTYNKHIKAKTRIKTKKQLKLFFENLNKGEENEIKS